MLWIVLFWCVDYLLPSCRTALPHRNRKISDFFWDTLSCKRTLMRWCKAFLGTRLSKDPQLPLSTVNYPQHSQLLSDLCCKTLYIDVETCWQAEARWCRSCYLKILPALRTSRWFPRGFVLGTDNQSKTVLFFHWKLSSSFLLGLCVLSRCYSFRFLAIS